MYVELKDEFTMEERGRTVSAALLAYPDIIYQGKGNGLIKAEITDFAWKETGGFLDNVTTLKQWAIIHDRNDSYVGDIVYSYVKIYCNMRRFDEQKGPIRMPDVREIDFGNERRYDSVVKNHDQILLVVLPEGNAMRSSQIKALFTKAVQHKYEEKQKSSPRCLVQFILRSNAENKNALIGTFEDMLGKIGNIIFKIDPKLPSGDKYISIDKTWSIGLDVSHVGGKPSVAMLCLNRNPLCGTSRYLTLMAHLNIERKEIVPFHAMATMTFEALQEAWHQPDINRDIKNLPKAIICFRDGVPDNRLLELHSKEVVGIQRGMKIFRQKYKLDKWKCKVNYFVASRSILDKFGVEKVDNNGRSSIPQPIEHPCVIFDGITSSRIWDFIVYGYHPKKDVAKTKPLRYICLKDEMKLAIEGGAYDLWQYIYALSYTFHFAIPFPLGGTAQVGPVSYAKHYAECFSQTITQADLSVKDLRLDNVQLPIRPGVICNILDIRSNDNGVVKN